MSVWDKVGNLKKKLKFLATDKPMTKAEAEEIKAKIEALNEELKKVQEVLKGPK